MNFNLPYILQNGMKILNIVNKTLPLVKEFNPALNFIQKKLKTANIPIAQKSTIKNTPTGNKPARVINNNNNSLTFFK